MSRRSAPYSPVRGGCTVNSSAPIMVRAMESGLRSLTMPCPRELAAPQDGHFVGKRHHLAEFVGDHEYGQSAARHHVTQHAEHLIGLTGRQHRGRFVEDEKTALQIKLLEDLAFLPLARGNRGNLCVERNAERHAVQKRFERLALARPVHDGGHVVARQYEVLRHRHRRHQREVLVDHAEAERMRRARIADHLLAVADDDLAFVGLVVAHDALDQRATCRRRSRRAGRGMCPALTFSDT